MMRAVVNTQMAALGVIVWLALQTVPACSTLPRVVGAETAAKVESSALKAAKTALTVWRLTQEGVLVYGRLPTCDPAVAVVKLCKDAAAWAKIQRIERTTSATILAAKPIVAAGSDDAAFLIGVAAAVNEAVIQIDEAKGAHP